MKKKPVRSILVIAFAALMAAIVACGGGPGSDGSRDVTASVAQSADSEQEPFADEAAEQVDFDDRVFAQVQSESEGVLSASTEGDSSVTAQAASSGADRLGGTGNDFTPLALQVANRHVIQTAMLTVQVDNPRAATLTAREVALTSGGFVEQLSVSGEGDGLRALVVIRVPQNQFFSAQDRITALGLVVGESVDSQDVSEQFVDLESRLRSFQAEETRLLDLLNVATTVSEILIVENELTRIRNDIEQVTGQRDFLSRRVSLATISVTFVRPEADPEPVVIVPQPPSATLVLAVEDVEAGLEEIKAMIASLAGIVDRSSLNVRAEGASATLDVRLPRAEFDAGVDGIEQLGTLMEKAIREGGDPRNIPPGATIAEPTQPDASLDLTLRQILSPVDEGGDGGLLGVVLLSVAVGLAALAVIGWGMRLRPRSGPSQ